MELGLSIIVPVYNTEKYLSKCIDSILNQTFSDFELILVNDGSTDRSKAICNEYARKDERIIVLDIKNGGPANARNQALKIAKGAFIGFIDSDDWIDPQMYESLLKKAHETASDLTFCNYITESIKGGKKEQVNTLPQSVFNREDIIRYFLPYFFGYNDSELINYKSYCPFADYHSYNVLCVMKSDIIRENQLRFPSEKIYFNEDNLFNLLFLFSANTISHVDGYYYHYRYNNQSISKSFNNRYLEMKLKKYQFLRQFVEDNHLDCLYLDRLKNKISIETVSILNYYAGSVKLNLSEKHQAVKEIVNSKEILSNIRDFKIKHLKFSKVKIYIILSKFKAYWAIVLISSIYKVISTLALNKALSV